MTFSTQFTLLLDKLPLSRFEKDIIKARFINAVSDLEMRYYKVRVLFIVLIQLITIAGVVIAALSPLQKASWITPAGETAIFWIIWALAIALTLANKWLYVFNVHKKYVLNIIVLEKYYSEGWSFLSSIGHYQSLNNWQEKHSLFCTRIEKIKLKSLENIPELEHGGYVNELLATGESNRNMVLKPQEEAIDNKDDVSLNLANSDTTNTTNTTNHTYEHIHRNTIDTIIDL
jgi:hypothetical protein